jgi:hypothetical protein
MLIHFVFALVMLVSGMAGGALSGVTLAGRDLGAQLAAMMGAFYGITVALPAAVVAALYLFYSTQRG